LHANNQNIGIGVDGKRDRTTEKMDKKKGARKKKG
jgi:hypothetical protein